MPFSETLVLGAEPHRAGGWTRRSCRRLELAASASWGTKKGVGGGDDGCDGKGLAVPREGHVLYCDPVVHLEDLRRVLAGRAARTVDPDTGGVRAAVAAVLRPGAGGPEVLMIRRATHPEDPWSGHMALPGGRMDTTDPSLLSTVLRETREEVALELEAHARLIGRLDEVATPPRSVPRSLVISPYVFELIGSPPALTPNREVAEIIWVALAPLKRGELDGIMTYRHEGQLLRLPAWHIEGRVVWGLTHRMLSSLLELV